MDELVQWLRAQLDEDERIAKAATHHEDYGTWAVESFKQRERFGRKRWALFDAVDDCVVSDVDAEGTEPEGVARHIAAHDPARVLREIDAKRQLLAIHRPYVAEPGQACLGCAGGIEWESCPVLRLVALPYADRPGFREEWRP